MDTTIELAILQYQDGIRQGYADTVRAEPPRCLGSTGFYWAGYEDGADMGYLFLELPWMAWRPPA